MRKEDKAGGKWGKQEEDEGGCCKTKEAVGGKSTMKEGQEEITEGKRQERRSQEEEAGEEEAAAAGGEGRSKKCIQFTYLSLAFAYTLYLTYVPTLDTYFEIFSFCQKMGFWSKTHGSDEKFSMCTN